MIFVAKFQSIRLLQLSLTSSTTLALVDVFRRFRQSLGSNVDCLPDCVARKKGFPILDRAYTTLKNGLSTFKHLERFAEFSISDLETSHGDCS